MVMMKAKTSSMKVLKACAGREKGEGEERAVGAHLEIPNYLNPVLTQHESANHSRHTMGNRDSYSDNKNKMSRWRLWISHNIPRQPSGQPDLWDDGLPFGQ